jgi:hypothetical protein
MVHKIPDNIVWQAQQGSQEAFLASTTIFEVLYHGSRGGGKTDCLLMSFCMHVGRGFGASWKGILFRQSFPQLTDVISKTKKWIPLIWPDAKYNASNHTWTWPTGEQLLLRQFNKEDDYWNYHGHEYPWIGWEELCNWPSDAGYKRMMSCCRSSTPGMPRMVRATTNPYGSGHNWVKRRFAPHTHNMRVRRDMIDEEGRLEPPRLTIASRLEENKILLSSDPDYIARIAAAAKNQAERKAWLDGDWNIVAGGMFDDVWDPNFNVIPPFIIPNNWRMRRSFDWGASKPFSVGWWAIANGEDVQLQDGTWAGTVKGDIFRVAEWYGCAPNKPNEGLDLLATEISEGIVERELKWGWRKMGENWCRVKGGVADSQIFAAENGNCIATDMKVKVRLSDGHKYPGIQWSPADKRPGSRATGWVQMRQMMKSAHPHKREDLDPETEEKVFLGWIPREKPGLFVFNTCVSFIDTVPVLPRDDKNLDDIDDDAEDHIADESRYLIRDLGAVGKSGTTTGHN